MWKIKLDDNLWLAKDSETTDNENQAWLFLNIPAAQDQLKKARRFMPYPNAMVIAEFTNAE